MSDPRLWYENLPTHSEVESLKSDLTAAQARIGELEEGISNLLAFINVWNVDPDKSKSTVNFMIDKARALLNPKPEQP